MCRITIGLLVGILWGCAGPPPTATEPPPRSAVEALRSADTTGFSRALAPRPFSFPGDHGPHPDFAVEWWYYTGNLATAEGRQFGYQLTFFRTALATQAPPRASQWASRQLYLAHFALTDADDGFHAHERFSRGALGLAGAQAAPFRVWLDDWSVTAIEPDHWLPARLHAAVDGVALDLVLTAGDKPIVAHGENGLSRKGETPGNASYYYSKTRLPSQGSVTLGETVYPVTGASWLDREWSTSVLEADQTGWDWFSLQLDDDREVMLFQLRRRDGTVSSASHGTWVDRDGSSHHLPHQASQLEVLDRWRSSQGVVYPAGWRLRIPSRGLDVTLRPLRADQELDVSFRYWEGAVEIRGQGTDGPVEGRGYVELVGYDDGADPAAR